MLLRLIVSAGLAIVLLAGAPASTAGSGETRTVVLLFPGSSEMSPANVLVSQGARAIFEAGFAGRVDVHNEFLDLSRFQDAGYGRLLAEYLRRKYAGRHVDLVIISLVSALDFALEHRAEVFPGVPIVFLAVDPEELATRALPPDVRGVPRTVDMAGTLDVALRLQPETRRVFVVAGSSRFDTHREDMARRAFRPYEARLEFVYLSGLPMADLLTRVARLPERSIIYYIQMFQDGSGKAFIPADVLQRVAAAANAPIYGTFDTYVGRGIVGGRVVSFEAEGAIAAELGLRVLAGERAETLAVRDTGTNPYMFDWRELRRWGLSEARLPPGSIVRNREPTLWDLYRWQIVSVIALCLVETLLIVGLLAQHASRRRAEALVRESQQELRALSGRLLFAQEVESRRIARELHDDLNQGLALLSVEMELLGQQPPQSASELGGRIKELLGRTRQLSSTVHELSHQLHPAKLEQLGLVATLGGLCKELSQGHGLEIEFTHRQMPAKIPRDTALCLYRIAQEALRNAVKHGGARHATAALSADAEAISLRIADDGAGFDPRLVQGKGGLGLVSMRERVFHLRGEIAIDSRPSHGTRLDVRIPLGATAGADGVQP